MQRGNVLLEHYLDKLNERRDDKDEDYSLQIPHPVRIEQIGLDGPGDSRRKEHDEYYRDSHSGGLIELLRHAEERADAEEFAEYVVVDQDGGHYYLEHQLEGFHIYHPLPLPCKGILFCGI